MLAIPTKRFDRPLLGFLSHPEMEAILDAPDRSTWSGQRDNVMLTTLYNTGARLSEVANLVVGDVDLSLGVPEDARKSPGRHAHGGRDHEPRRQADEASASKQEPEAAGAHGPRTLHQCPRAFERRRIS